MTKSSNNQDPNMQPTADNPTYVNLVASMDDDESIDVKFTIRFLSHPAKDMSEYADDVESVIRKDVNVIGSRDWHDYHPHANFRPLVISRTHPGEITCSGVAAFDIADPENHFDDPDDDQGLKGALNMFDFLFHQNNPWSYKETSTQTTFSDTGDVDDISDQDDSENSDLLERVTELERLNETYVQELDEQRKLVRRLMCRVKALESAPKSSCPGD